MIRVTLWGNRAFEFSYESIYDSQKQDPIIFLFVGCLPKEFIGLFQILHIFTFVLFSCANTWLYVVSNFFVYCSHFPFSIGIRYLGGAAACHWYFNPTIREVAPYYKRYMYLL
jgi:hypothetical protein